MLKIIEGSYKGYRFQFAYSNATELKLLILRFQNTIDFVFCDVYLAHNYQNSGASTQLLQKMQQLPKA